MKCSSCGTSHAPHEMRPFPPRKTNDEKEEAFCVDCLYGKWLACEIAYDKLQQAIGEEHKP